MNLLGLDMLVLAEKTPLATTIKNDILFSLPGFVLIVALACVVSILTETINKFILNLVRR